MDEIRRRIWELDQWYGQRRMSWRDYEAWRAYYIAFLPPEVQHYYLPQPRPGPAPRPDPSPAPHPNDPNGQPWDTASPLVGHPKVIGQYDILDLIGEGGMGVVYRARHRWPKVAERQGGDVAFKVMHKIFAADADYRARFEREARLGIRLSHPRIVPVYFLAVENDLLGMVMELVRGQTLLDCITGTWGPLPWVQAAWLCQQLLDAIGYAHSQEVIHRDIKPANVMYCPDQNIKVLDFGIARDNLARTTKSRHGLGSVPYMAPEQYTCAADVDHRADIYSIGMTLYELLAGRLPWSEEDNEYSIQKQKVAGSLPPPTEFYPGIPDRVVRVIERATRVVPEERYSSCAEMRVALGL